MSKYIIDIPNVIEWGVVTCRTKDEFYTRDFDSLDELNSDYINEHFGSLQDTAYQRGLEDGKKEAESSEAIEQAKADAFNKGMLYKEEKLSEAYQRGLEEGKAQAERGCKGCEYEGKTGEHLPCEYCKNNFRSQWTAKDDKIEVGDVVTIKHLKHSDKYSFVVTKVSDESVWGVDEDGGWNYWAINEVIKTDKHFDIDKILEEMRHD